MSTQSMLPGFDPPPTLTDRLFLAVLPDPGVAAQVAHLAQRLRDEHRLAGKPLDDKRLHVSLQGLGDHPGLPRELIARAGQAASTVALAPFALGFDRAMSFSGKSHRPGRRAFVLLPGEHDVAGLAALYQALAAALQKVGLAGSWGASFTPHMTLLYDEQTAPLQAVDPITWTVREFALVRSQIGKGLPYELLGRWPLEG